MVRKIRSDSYLFLATDYQNSIWAVMDQAGNILEEMAYDPWGNRREASTGNPTYLPGTSGQQSFSGLLFRGYTLHEHLDIFGLINMNGRLYDPQLGRILSPDNFVQNPTSTQNFNRYSYVLNNPLKYTDPDGEVIFTTLSAIFNPALLPMAIQADIGWITGGISSEQNGGTFLQGALLGGTIGAINGGLSMISPVQIPFGKSSFGLSIAPQLAVGTDGMGFGLNATVGYEFAQGFTAGVNLGGTYYASAAGTGTSGFEGRIGYGIGYDGGNFQAGIGSTYFFSGETSQQAGQVYAGGGNRKLTYENDTWAPVPGLINPGGAEVDKFRTAALRLDFTGGRLKGASAGLLLFTGASDGRIDPNQGPNGTFREQGIRYRLGALYVGYRNYRVGYNSERNIRGPIQNGFHNLMGYPHFEVLDKSDKFYGGYYSSNPFTLW